ncbi:MAG TPA: T9SS type A sorting domain-containing protein, partial [Saprospiraceae bacterium]|nr:T9SS type A sorting domain-containing protein [Saprospiraceae bacterium]
NQYFFIDYINGSLGDPYFLLIDSDSGEINCQEVIEEINGIVYSPGGLVTNNLSGEIIGHRNGRIGIINPCNGTMTKLLEIPDYHSHLNNQMAVYNHSDNTYIIPYYSNSPSDQYKMALVDVYTNEIIETRSQPWNGRMNIHQIYDKPTAPIVCLKDTLYVPKGEHYKWFLNDQFIGETEQNYWVPVENGTYKAEIEYREYTTFSLEKDIYISSTEESKNHSSFEIFPNPTSNFINLDFSQSANGVVKIIDLTGQIVYRRMVKEANNIQIDLDGLSKGIYIINIQTEQNQISKTFSKL